MEKESSRQVEVRAKLEDEVKELKNLVKELKVDVVVKDIRLGMATGRVWARVFHTRTWPV